MGLSDEERLSKMVWAINALSRLGRELKDLDRDELPHDSNVSLISDYTDQLWHAYLGGDSNGAFWLLGGDHNNPVTQEGAPWSTAIMYQCETNRPRVDGVVTWEELSSKEFNPFRGFLDVPGLLPKTYQKKVYEIYGWTEQLSYALRRYKDALSDRYGELNKLISDIQGACFDIFAKDTGFGKAYVANRLFEELYRDEKAKKVLKELNTHHDLGSRIRSTTCSLTEIIAWDRWRLEHKKTTQNTLVLALRICGSHFHYDHQFKKMVDLTRKMDVKERVLRREFEKCKVAKASAEEKMHASFRGPEEAAMAIHGYEVYKLFEKEGNTDV